ncbi:MAG: permease prefix domain 1-containing protein [Isosphaeraceae bacterium]
MYDQDVLSAHLPPPRHDEPAGLRRDILDELADHLGCAYNHELLSGVGPEEARRRVMERFGDPAALARRLWFDAMKGKIMAQRVLIATCFVVTLASLSMAGLFWQQSIQARRDSVRAAAEARAGQQDMLKQLHEMSEAIRNPRSPLLIPVKFEVRQETPDGPPLAECSIELQQVDPVSNRKRSLVTDASGVADFGILQPAEYQFEVIGSWGDSSLAGSGKLSLEPGTQVHQTIVCPRTLLERVAVRIRCDWPADLGREGLVLEAPFVISPINQSGVSWTIGHRWKSTGSPEETTLGAGFGSKYRGVRPVLCGPGSAAAEIFNQAGLYFFCLESSQGENRAAVLARDIRAVETPGGTMMWERGRYRLNRLAVLRPIAPSDGSGPVRQFEVLAESDFWRGGTGRPGRAEPPTEEELKMAQMGLEWSVTMGVEKLELPAEYWSRLNKSFEARPGQLNEWTIPLPDKLTQVVREKLKVK